MPTDLISFIGYLGGIALGWGLRGYMEKRSREKNKKRFKPWLDRK